MPFDVSGNVEFYLLELIVEYRSKVLQKQYGHMVFDVSGRMKVSVCRQATAEAQRWRYGQLRLTEVIFVTKMSCEVTFRRKSLGVHTSTHVRTHARAHSRIDVHMQTNHFWCTGIDTMRCIVLLCATRTLTLSALC